MIVVIIFCNGAPPLLFIVNVIATKPQQGISFIYLRLPSQNINVNTLNNVHSKIFIKHFAYNKQVYNIRLVIKNFS